MKSVYCLLLILLLAACAPAAPAALEEPTPTPSAAELQDAQYYADEMGITLEEALARLSVQNDEAISTLQTQLHANEAATFAGLWLQHEPDFRVVVAFTRDGEETIQKYVTDDNPLTQLIEVRQVPYTYAQLEADQQEAFRILDALNLSAGGGIMVMDNQVVIDITDRAAFDAALAAADVTLPESVVVNTLYEPVGETPPFAITPVPDLFMPQLKQRDVAFMEALLIGELVVEAGCLRVRDVYSGELTLVIWQADYFLTDNEGILEILDEMGAVAARVGEMVYLGGGEQRTVDNAELRQPVPELCAGGPYWRMGTFLPEEYIPNVAADLPPLTQSFDGAKTGFAFDYPARWQVNDVREDDEGITAVLASRPMSTDEFEPFQPGDEMAAILFMPSTEPINASAEGLLAAMERYAANLPPNQTTTLSPHTLVLANRPTAVMAYQDNRGGTAVETYFMMTADSDRFIWAMDITPVGENWQIRLKMQELVNSLQPVHADGWQSYAAPDLNLSFTYPADWFVHDAGKAIQITPNAQPTWSSFFDPDEPHGGPTFDLLHNLNRLMGPTPLAEVETLLQGYEADIEPIAAAAPLADRPDVVVGVYRFTVEDDTMALLVGAAANPAADSPQSAIAMTGLVKLDELAAMQPIFEAILRSLGPAAQPLSGTPANG